MTHRDIDKETEDERDESARIMMPPKPSRCPGCSRRRPVVVRIINNKPSRSFSHSCLNKQCWLYDDMSKIPTWRMVEDFTGWRLSTARQFVSPFKFDNIGS